MTLQNLYHFAHTTTTGQIVQGLFTAEQRDVKWIVGKSIHFQGYIDHPVTIGADDITLISENSEMVAWFRAAVCVMGPNAFGLSPFDWLGKELTSKWVSL